MRLSYNWLSDFVTWKVKDSAEIAKRLTLSVAEIEDVIHQDTYLKGCCVGKILAVLPHPNASKLRLADVETDRGTVRVVCGGTNLSEGMLVAFAHVGSTVLHGEETLTLTEAVIRGEKSAGMLCAAEELGLEELFPSTPDQGERPIIDLTPLGLTAGDPLHEALGMDDVVFDVNNTAITNRPDLFSHIGFARECVAAGIAQWKKAEPTVALPKKFPKADLPFALKIEAKSVLPGFHACALDVDALGEAPAWMKRRLTAVGIRSISLPVDITNYVMMEMGCPLHAFDTDDIRGTVRLRLTEDGESLVTLDGVARTLPRDTIVLSDDEGVFDIVGMMGGKRSSTKDSTRRFFLQAPVPDAASIRRAIAATGHRTDASTIFEKGLPPEVSAQGFARALELFLSLVPGARLTSSLVTVEQKRKMPTITLHEARIAAIGGVEIGAAEAKKTLTTLGCTVKAAKKGVWSVTPPPWRAKDLAQEEDLIDDILRLHGYDRMAPTLPLAPVRLPERDGRTATARHALAADGFNEILPLSLLSEQLLKRAGIESAPRRRVQSPLSEDLAVLQPSTLPGLLEHAQANLLHVERHLRTFRICTVFSADEEHLELGMLAADRAAGTLRDEPVIAAKESLLHMLLTLGITATCRSVGAAHPWMHPGKSAEVRVGDAPIGHVCTLHPDIAAAFDLPSNTAVALVHWSAVLAMKPERRPILAPPAFPAVVYDVTVARGHEEHVGPLLAHLRKAHPLVESVHVQDLFSPKNEDRYRLTLRFVYRAPDRTLTEKEAQDAHDTVLRAGQLSPLS